MLISRFAFVAALSLVVGAGCHSLHREGDYRSLFDGNSLNGWVKQGGAATYRVEDGAIVGSTSPNTPNTFLCTERAYSDFELLLEFKVDTRMNSGVQFRSVYSEEPLSYENGGETLRVAPGVVHGYQYEIDPSGRRWTAGVYDESRRGWLFDLSEKPEAGAAFQRDAWNQLRILAVGDHIQTWINGVPAADFHDDMTTSGIIALQVHGVGERTEPMEIRWRNIRIREM